MKKNLLTGIFTFIIMGFLNSQSLTDVNLLKQHIFTLAHDSMRGRDAGSNEGLIAAYYIEQQFKEIGLKPFNDTSFIQPFFIQKNVRCRNVIGMIEGSDLLLKDEYIIIGAHYDHIGYKMVNDKQLIYNGADDNASGTAALIELARLLKANEGSYKRSIILVAFDAEEQGLLGSKFLSNQLEPEKIKLMISLDMIGYLKESKKLHVRGVATIKDGKKLIHNLPLPADLKLQLKDFETSMLGATDTEYFAKEEVPTLHITTGLKSPYHKPEDDAERIDYEGLATINDFMYHFSSSLATKENLAASGKLSPKHNGGTAPIEGGLILNIGSNAFHYRKTAFQSGKPGFAFAGGFFLQFNTRYISFRPEILYENKSAYRPLTNSYDSKAIKFNVQSITVPFSIILKGEVEPGYYFFYGIGGYYTYNFHAKMDGVRLSVPGDTYPNEGGIQTTIGLTVQKVTINGTLRNGISNVFNNTPKVTNNAIYFGIAYAF